MKDLVIISGPTGVGKSKASIELCKKIGGSVISADSMQVYRGMDIGTAKITHEEMEGIPHYLIDVCDPSDDFNIVTFKQMATGAIEEITSSGRIPVIVGGTGFYIQSVLYDIDFSIADELTQYREYLYELLEEKGSEHVHQLLEAVDPVAAKKIHKNDHKRVIRALEYYRQTGDMISDHNSKSLECKSPYNFCYFFLNDDRNVIYDRINRRVDKMMDNGLVDEVRRLTADGLTKEHVSMHGIGYKEIIDYLEGNCTLDEATDMIKKLSRHYAKRQITWARRTDDVIFIDINDGDIIDNMCKELTRKGIIHG